MLPLTKLSTDLLAVAVPVKVATDVLLDETLVDAVTLNGLDPVLTVNGLLTDVPVDVELQLGPVKVVDAVTLGPDKAVVAETVGALIVAVEEMFPVTLKGWGLVTVAVGVWS